MRVIHSIILGFAISMGGGALWAAPPTLGLPPVPVPVDNPQSAGKAALGKQLFEDKRFSGDGTVSCATCHNPAKAFADGLPVAEGIGKQKGSRNSPTVLNAAYNESQFWDGRRPSLEAQAKDPFLNPIEHGLKSHEPILQIVRSDPAYVRQFRDVFNVEDKRITIEHVVQAIAAFERTAISGDSPFDRYLYGGDRGAMSEAAIRQNVRAALSTSPYYVGVNNHMGSLMTEDAGAMNIILSELHRRGLFFIDSRTSPGSKACKGTGWLP